MLCLLLIIVNKRRSLLGIISAIAIKDRVGYAPVANPPNLFN
ncbi:hypothetical protein ACOWPH_11555 [Anabaena sp. PCC 7938]|nr:MULTISPECIES: hypothetical protein [Anabaena]